MFSIALSSRIKIQEDVLFRELEGEGVMLNVKTGIYFGLDPVGTQIWQLMNQHRRFDKILTAMQAKYEVHEQRLQDDLLRFINSLRQNGLIHVIDD